MPSFFDAAPGAGQAALGAQAYRAGALENEGRATRNRAASEALARAIEEANDDKEMKATWAKALGEVLSMREAQAPEGDEAAVDAFYAAKDDPTQAAIQRLRGMAQRVARTDPKAAQALVTEFGGAIRERAMEGRLRAVHESASKAITGIQDMTADGLLSEAAAQQMSDQVQQVLEALDEDPERLMQGSAAIQKIRATATAEYLKGAEKANAKAEMQGLVDRLPPSAKRFGALAMAQLANGGEPAKVLAQLAERVYGTADPDPATELERPGAFERSPSWVQARIRAEAQEDALTFLSKLKMTDKLGRERSMTPDEIQAELPKWEPMFLQRTMARHNKVSQPMPAPGGARPGGAVGAPEQQAELQKVLSAPAPARGMDLRAGTEGMPGAGGRPSLRNGTRPSDRASDAGDKVVRGERKPVSIKGLRKKGKNEDPMAYLEYVKKAISQRGGTGEDVARALEAAGLSPADFQGAGVQ